MPEKRCRNPHFRRFWAGISSTMLVVILLSSCQSDTGRQSLEPTPTSGLETTHRALTETLRPSPESTGAPGPSAQATSTPGERSDPSFSEINPRVTSEDQIRQAIADLAARFNLNQEDIRVADQYPDEFPASGLGCFPGKTDPLPIPALVSGKVIILSAGDTRYIYHARLAEVVYCGTDPSENSNGK